MTQLAPLETAFAGLLSSTPELLPFAPRLVIRAFLLRRDQGNVLVYSTRGLEADAPALAQAGGVARHYLNHGHEAMFAAPSITAPRFVHEGDRGAVEAAYPIRGTFSRRHRLDEDFEVIPTPGHTPGATAYLWDSGEHRFLFTGDTIHLDGGEWVAAILDSSDRAAYLDSLGLLAELKFDVLVPWAAPAGEPFAARTDGADARDRIDAIRRRVAAGANR